MTKLEFRETDKVDGIYIVFNRKEKEEVMELKRVLDFYLYKIKVRNATGKFVYVSLLDIYYIEVLDGQCYFYGKKEIFTCLESFKTLKEKLNGNGFLQCNKIQMINEIHLEDLQIHTDCQRIAKLDNGEIILVSRKYRKSIDNFKNPQKASIMSED